MATQRPSWSGYDTVPTVNMSDRKLQSGGKITRDPSPRPALAAQTERGVREDEWSRRERRREPKERYKEPLERDKYHNNERRQKMPKDGERDRRVENQNVRPLSNIEKENTKEGDRGVGKGDTFPRSARSHGPIVLSAAMEAEREERRQRKREDRDRDRRERDRPKDGDDRRRKDARDDRTRDRYLEADDRRRGADGEDRRDRYAPRKNDAQREERAPRESRRPSPTRSRDRDMYRDKAQRREGIRDTRSEGELDEREKWRKEIVRNRDEGVHQHSRSEGETRGKREHRSRDRYTETEYRSRNRDDRCREDRDYERRTRRERDDDRQGKSSQDGRRREERSADCEDHKRERRASRERTREPDTEPFVSRNVLSKEEQEQSEQRIREKKKKVRQMWLEPKISPASKDATSVKEVMSDREVVESCSGEETEEVSVDGELEEIWLNRRGSFTGDSEGSDADFISDRERIVSGEDGFITVSSGNEDEDDREDEFKDCVEFCVGERDANQAQTDEETADDSSEVPGRDAPPKFVFCLIGQVDGEIGESLTPTEKKIEHEYDEVCEISEETHGPSRDRTSIDGVELRSDFRNEFGTIKRDSKTEKLLMRWREQADNQKEEEEDEGRLTPIPRNPYADVPGQPPHEQTQSASGKPGALTPEEEEAVRIRLSGAWSMSEEPKRHSQAPHLKWAKNIVREILGKSEENSDSPEESHSERPDGALQIPVIKADDDDDDDDVLVPEEEELESLEMEGLRGMDTGQGDTQGDVGQAVHGDTHTDTPVNKETPPVDAGVEAKLTEAGQINEETPPVDAGVEAKLTEAGQIHEETPPVDAGVEAKLTEAGQINEETPHVPVDAEVEAKLTEAEQTNDRKDIDEHLTVSDALCKPNSSQSLSCESDASENEGEHVIFSSPDKQGEREPAEEVAAEAVTHDAAGKVEEKQKGGAVNLTSSCSFRDLGSEVRFRRRGIRKMTERRKEGPVKEEDEEDVEEEEKEEKEGAGRDRRTRIFSTSDDEETRSKSWGELDLRNVLDTIGKRKRNSKFFKAAQLYQQYSEAAQNIEILRQARSDVVSVSEGSSPLPARRPLPPLPQVRHPHSLSHSGSVCSAQNLPLPPPPPAAHAQRRASSPRLSISIGQSTTLWRDLPGVRDSPELQELTEDQRRLQEVRFEVITSEASYCRSLDIVVEHFVKCKQLGTLLTTQDRNWLFSRLSDVRAISHSFLSKLEEKVDSDTMNFSVCDVIARHCQRFKMVYVPYLTNQSYQDATYQRLMNENQGFRRIVEKLERSSVCQRLPLRSFLVLPFQRITRIKLLVQNIVKRTTPGTPEAIQAIKALRLLEKLIQDSNNSITQMKSIESLVSLSAKVDFECKTLPLVSQSRILVREGKVTQLMEFSLKEQERSLYLHLFNDNLLVSQQKEGGRFTVIDTCPVSELRVENFRIKLHSLQKNVFRLHMSTKSLLLRTDTQSDKLRWISALSRPHPEVDFTIAQDFPQMQCIRAFVAQQPDELSLEKADIILVHQQSSDHWVEGTRLSDGQRGWIPEHHLDTISNPEIRKRNLSDALKLTAATAQV